MATNLGYHSCTGMAVKAVVSEVRKRLSTRFNFIPDFPEFFYDFEKGPSPQYLQYYAKIPAKDRGNDWICLAYSYDVSERSSYQGRRGFEMKRQVSKDLYRYIDFNYASLPVIFSVMTNSSKVMNALSNFVSQKLDWSFTTTFEDLLWPNWISDSQYPPGWYIRPKKPNGCLYMCTTSGLSGDKEPEWTTSEGSIQVDNEVEWTCVIPQPLEVKAGDFVKKNAIISNPMENGIMYQYDFGYSLHYVDFDDNGKLLGRITKAELTLLSKYNKDVFKETITVPD